MQGFQVGVILYQPSGMASKQGFWEEICLSPGGGTE